jgi:polyisoprenoid-binding protein YceI
MRARPALFLATALAGCPTRPAPPPAPVLAPPAPPPAAPRIGRPYDIVAGESLLTVLVYRGGALASAGHNHVIASHALAGAIYVPDDDVLNSSFEVHVPVAALTVDEPDLRSAQRSADFPPEVSQGARDGTRRNMLSSAVLAADEYPEVVLRAVRLESASPPQPGELTVHLEAQVREQRRTLSIAVHYQRAGDTLTITGETPLRQSELGLTPFTALMGALAVQDEMRVRIRLVARAAAPP